MNILGFDTSQQACSVALLKDDQLFSSHEIQAREQARHILVTVDRLLSEAHLTLSDLDALAFGAGPGSFTGVRIAVSVAQGLAYAANLPVIPVSSLRCLAQTAYEQEGVGEVIVAVDARMHEIYCGAFSLDVAKHMQFVLQEQLLAPSALIVPFSGDYHVVGDAFLAYSEDLKTLIRHKPLNIMPHASALLTLAVEDFTQGRALQAFEAAPVYLRDPV